MVGRVVGVCMCTYKDACLFGWCMYVRVHGWLVGVRLLCVNVVAYLVCWHPFTDDDYQFYFRMSCYFLLFPFLFCFEPKKNPWTFVAF